MTRCPREQLEDTPYALERERVLAELPPVLSEQSVTVHRLLNHRNTSSSGIEMGDAVGCGAPQKFSGQLRMSKTPSTVHEYRVFAWHRRLKSDGRDTSNDTQGGAVHNKTPPPPPPPCPSATLFAPRGNALFISQGTKLADSEHSKLYPSAPKGVC